MTVRLELLGLLRTGALGPVRLGLSREQVREALGEPELAAGPVWKYGSVELFFVERGEPGLRSLQVDDFPLRGGAGVLLEPGWLRQGLPLAEARARLAAEGLAYAEGEPAFEVVKLTLASGVELHFSLEPGRQGLSAISQSQ